MLRFDEALGKGICWLLIGADVAQVDRFVDDVMAD